jgi:peroxiredoxin
VRTYNPPVAFPAPGTPLPPIALRDEKGQAAPPLRGDTLYAFFKTTCPTCSLAWPYLDRIRQLGEAGRLAVIGVSQDDLQTTRRFLERLGVSIPTLYDPEPWSESERLGLTTVPTFLLVGADGIVRDTATGFQRHKMEEFAKAASARTGQPTPALFTPADDAPALKPG